jgi:hypothetical protein
MSFFCGLDQVSKMSKQLNVEENLEDQLENLALQENGARSDDQAGAGVAQESSSKVSPIFFISILIPGFLQWLLSLIHQTNPTVP